MRNHNLFRSATQSAHRQLRRSRRTDTRPWHHKRDFSGYLVTPREFMQEFVNSIPVLSGKPEPPSRIVPVCASWFMPNDPEKRTGIGAYHDGHIPQARFFDLDFIKDDKSPYPHMLPNAKMFASCMGYLNISQDDTVVVYDTVELGIFSAPRVAWTFKAFGHQRVHILNNYREYVRQGFPTVKGSFKVLKKEECSDYRYGTSYPKGVADFGLMEKLAAGEVAGGIAVDARSKARFDGTEPEPRKGLNSGHMPKSINLPFTDVLDARTKAFLPAPRLKEIFTYMGVEEQWPIVSSCGTGVTAAIIDVALAEAGFADKQRLLYDGSWTEWASRIGPGSGMILNDRKPAKSTTFREMALEGKSNE